MTIQPDGTAAKDIALYFIRITGGSLSTSNVGKTIIQAKKLLSLGYKKQNIIDVIDYLIASNINIYSLGYLFSCIESTLNTLEVAKKAKTEKEKLTLANQQQQSEVVSNLESSERNKRKLKQFGVQSRFGEKFNFDLFEE